MPTRALMSGGVGNGVQKWTRNEICLFIIGGNHSGRFVTTDPGTHCFRIALGIKFMPHVVCDSKLMNLCKSWCLVSHPIRGLGYSLNTSLWMMFG
jgi:hypothetical protein